MPTTEELLGLDKDGWQHVARMNESELKEYLKDIMLLEPAPAPPNMEMMSGLKKENSTEESEIDEPLTSSESQLDKLKEEVANEYPDSPFAKKLKKDMEKKKAKKKGYILPSDEATLEEAEALRKELGL